MKRIGFCLIAGLTVCSLSAGLAWAQATAQIAGTVRDQSGAVLPGVEITVTQTETGVMRNAVTNETGTYIFPNLPIGPYKLEAALGGFRTFVQTGIVLEVNGAPVVNPILEVGQVSEQVEVQANAALVETRSAGVGQVMENTRILDLPLNGRNVVELLALTGASGPATTDTGSSRDPFARGNVSIAGGLSSGLNYNLDGANHNNQFSGSYLSMPFPDAMQEFKVETSATSAQTGVKSSGAVSLVTKSGTNAIHGDAFEFVRNYLFNARNAFATARDSIKRNQYGGTIGGPILKNKLFFFGAYQGTTVRQAPAQNITYVPTASMLAGDFTSIASAACNSSGALTLRGGFVNNRINPASFSPAAVKFAGLLPTTADPCGRIVYADPNLLNDPMAIGRIDFQKSEKHSIFGRYLVESNYNPPAYEVNKNIISDDATGGLGTNGLAQAFGLGDTYLLGSKIVNSLRFNANRMAGGKIPANFANCHCWGSDLGLDMYTYLPHDPRVSVTGAFTANAQGGTTRLASFGVNDDVSVVHGNQQFAFGVNTSLWWVNSYSNAYESNYAFNGTTTGLGLADFLLGDSSQFVAGTPVAQHYRSKAFGLYVNDTWKYNQKLTFNLGLRWEPYFPQVNLDGSSIHYDEAALFAGKKTNRFVNAPPGVFFDTDPGFAGRSGMNNQWKNFSPRVGIAWDLRGDGRTSIRASVGTFYDYPAGIYQRSLTTVPPWAPRYTLNNVNFDHPWAGYPGGNPLPQPYGGNLSSNIAWTPYSIVTAMDYDSPTMRVGQWTLALQKQIGSDWLLSATYLGNATRHLWTTRPLNNPVFLGLGACSINGVPYPTCSTTANENQRRRLSLQIPSVGQYYGFVNKIDTGGTAAYDGLILTVQRRPVRGVTVSANYTLSHCITDIWQETAQGVNANTGWSDPNNRRFDRGNCTLSEGSAADYRQLFNVSGVAETPEFSNRTVRTLGSGWRLSPIVKLISGPSLSVITSIDRSLTGWASQRVNQVSGNPYGAKTFSNYLNSTAFALPDLGTLGNSGSGAIRGPGTWQFDAALSRVFQVREAKKIEFRAEAFNLLNGVRMDVSQLSLTLNSSTFGRVQGALDPRIMQFALKYFF